MGGRFEPQTAGELAAVAGEPAVAEGEQGVVTGEFPLSPVQRWFFARGLPEPSHYNQSVLLEAPGGVEPELVRVAVRAVVEHHDALRSRFTNDSTGWTGRVLPADSAEMLWVVAARRDRGGVNSVASVRSVSAGLSAERASRLLRDVPGVFGTQINDVLLAALGLTLTPWTRTAAVVVDVEGHGREDVGGGVDV